MYKNWKYCLLLLLLLIGQASFADGGIPLWITSTPALLSLSAWGDMIGGFVGIIIIYILVLLSLLMVTLIEVFVAKFVLKNTKFLKLFRVFYIANLVSTLAGAIIISIPIPFIIFSNIKMNLSGFLFGPWSYFNLLPYGYTMLLLNIILFLISFYIEFYIGNRFLKQDYEEQKIKKAFWYSNIVTYILPVIISVCICFSEWNIYMR